MRRTLLPLLLLCPLLARAQAPLSLDAAVRRAVEVDPGLRAAGLRIEEGRAAERAAAGAFDTVLLSTLDLASTRRTANRVERVFNDDGMFEPGATREENIDTFRGTFDVGLRQPLVWGTVVQFAWVHGITDTDDPLFPCGALLTEEACFESRVELSLRQPLLRGFGRDATEGAAEEARAAGTVAERQRVAEAATLVEAVVAGYAELARALSDRAIRQNALSLAREQLEASRARVELGALAPVDLPVVEQAVAEREQAAFIAEQRVADRGASLAVLLDLEAPPAVEVGALAAWPETLAAAEEQARASNPELAVLDAEIARQRATLPALEDAVLPQLDLTVVAAQTGNDEDLGGAIVALGDDDTHFYGATLDFELPFGNATAEGRLEQSRLALRRLKAQREAQRREVRRAAGEAWRAVRTAQRTQALAERIVELAERSLKAERAKFDAGRTTNLDVLRVQQELAEAQLAVAGARVDRLLARTRLQRVLGRLLPAYDLALD